jgi:hypothetical protein
LIAWYKRNGYEDTGEREPFPASDVHIPIAEPLEFIVMEKRIGWVSIYFDALPRYRPEA